MSKRPIKERAYWTQDDEASLLLFLNEHKAEGDSGGFKKATWNGAAIYVNATLTRGGMKTGESCKGKFRLLKATYEVVKAIRDNPGWSWDDEKGADITRQKKAIWDDYVARNPAAEAFRNAGWVHLEAFDDLNSSSARGGHAFRASRGLNAGDNNEEPTYAQHALGDEFEANEGSSSQAQLNVHVSPAITDEPSTPPPNKGKRRATSPGFQNDSNKRVRTTRDNQMINSLNITMNRDTVENAFRPSPPVCVEEVTNSAMALEKDCLGVSSLPTEVSIGEKNLARKRKREEDDIHELEGQRRTPPDTQTMTTVDTSTPVHISSSALASASAFLVSDSAEYTELEDETAKYSFLKNSDLMAETFSHLQVENDEENRRCLFSAALTCKDFLDVALDSLWAKLDSLVPLLKLLPALQVEGNAYVLSGKVSQADWNRLQYYSRKVKFFAAMSPYGPQVHPSTYIRIAQLQSSALLPSLRHFHYNLGDRSMSHIFLFLSPLLDSLELYDFRGLEDTIVGPFLATLSSQMLSRIVLRNGRISADILKKSIVEFKQLRSLELSDAVFMSDFVLWEVLGTLPSLANLTLKASDPEFHPKHAPENLNSQSGGPKYFDALETLSVTGSFFFIQHLLGFIDSPCLKSINIYPVMDYVDYDYDHEPEPDNLFIPSMTIVASKWSRSLRDLVIGSSSSHRYAISKSLMLLTDLHEMQTFHLKEWRMGNMNDDVKRLVMSWPKLKTLRLPLKNTIISLSTLRIIAENCPELRYLDAHLDTSTIPPFDASSKSIRHNLEVLTVGRVNTYSRTALNCEIKVARYLDLIFPNLKSIEVLTRDETWTEIRDLFKLCQDIRRDK